MQPAFAAKRKKGLTDFQKKIAKYQIDYKFKNGQLKNGAINIFKLQGMEIVMKFGGRHISINGRMYDRNINRLPSPEIITFAEEFDEEDIDLKAERLDFTIYANSEEYFNEKCEFISNPEIIDKVVCITILETGSCYPAEKKLFELFKGRCNFESPHCSNLKDNPTSGKPGRNEQGFVFWETLDNDHECKNEFHKQQAHKDE